METPTSDEKKVLVKPPIAVRTTHIREKTSEDTLTTPARRSDISTPTSATANPFDTDVEAMMSGVTTSETVSGPSGASCHHNTSGGDLLGRKSTNLVRGESQQEYCQVWPGRGHWKRKAKAAKRKNRSCNCLAGLSPRNRLIVKILIGILVVAAAVGVGFGISKPLGAQIWKPSTR